MMELGRAQGNTPTGKIISPLTNTVGIAFDGAGTLVEEPTLDEFVVGKLWLLNHDCPCEATRGGRGARRGPRGARHGNGDDISTQGRTIGFMEASGGHGGG